MLRRAAISLSVSLLLAGCSRESMRIDGVMDSVDIMGHECWYIATPQLKTYEIYSEDPNLLRKGLKVRLEAKKSQRETVCKIGVLLDVLSYKVVD